MTKNKALQSIFGSRLRLVGRLAALALLVSCFQGFTQCGSPTPNFSAGVPAPLHSASEGGGSGGDGYPAEGKPLVGVYYRNIPGYECGGKPRIYSVLEVGAESAKLKTVNSADCTDLEAQIALPDVFVSALSPDLALVRGGIYEKLEVEPSPGAPLTITEKICRVRREPDVKYDLVITETQAGGALSAELVSSSGTNAVGVTRQSTASRLSYVGSGLTLDMISAIRGRVRATIAGITIDEEADCNGGSMFDPVMPGVTTMYLAAPRSATGIAGQTFPVNIHMDARPLGPRGYPSAVCLTFYNERNEAVVAHNCQLPPMPAETALGEENFAVQATLPADTPPGNYKIAAGYQKWTGTEWLRFPLIMSEGVVASPVGTPNEVIIGDLTLSN